MKQNIKIILISLVVSFASITFALNVPAIWFNVQRFIPQTQKFGNLSLTTLQGTDNLTNFPTTYNANNTIINNGKEDISDLQSTSTLKITTLTSLASIGTITSGTWHGTAVGAQWGGNGSTTLSANQVLLGNGTGNIGIVSGWGTSGQSLVSNGGTSAPSWQSASFDTTQNYLLTGNWNFTANTLLKNLIASSTIVINNGGSGVSYSFPTSNGVSGSFLANNGSGSLSWTAFPTYLIGTTTASTTPYDSGNEITGPTISIPGNTLGTGNILTLQVQLNSINTSAANSNTFKFYYGATSITCGFIFTNTLVSNWVGNMIFKVIENGVANQVLEAYMTAGLNSGINSSLSSGAMAQCESDGTATIDSTTAQTMKITSTWANNTSGTPTLTFTTGIVTLNK